MRLWRKKLENLGWLTKVSKGHIEQLAADYEFTGASIDNAILHAAYIAAELKAQINGGLLNQSCQLESLQGNRLVQGLDLQGLLARLTESKPTRAEMRRTP